MAEHFGKKFPSLFLRAMPHASGIAQVFFWH